MTPELLQLAEERPANLNEFRTWCESCYATLEELELADANTFNPNQLHEHAALLVRQALVYVRRFVDPTKADNMPRVGAKCVSHALIRFQECIDWCGPQQNSVREKPDAQLSEYPRHFAPASTTPSNRSAARTTI